MEPWKLILIAVLSAVALGVAAGVLVGKYQVNRSRKAYKPLLSVKERVIYFVCFALGAGCILFAVFLPLSSPDPSMLDGGMAGPGMERGAMKPGRDGVPVGDGGTATEPDGESGETAAENDGETSAGDEEGTDFAEESAAPVPRPVPRDAVAAAPVG